MQTHAFTKWRLIVILVNINIYACMSVKVTHICTCYLHMWWGSFHRGKHRNGSYGRDNGYGTLSNT